jgi:hypothetical protein
MADDTTGSHNHDQGAAGEPDGAIPLGQRLFDSPFLLLVLCLVVMFLFYTGWGLWEVFTLPTAPLP